MDNLYEKLFGTLDRKYCAYYQILMYISFGTVLVSVVTVLFRAFSKGLGKFKGFEMIDGLSILSSFVSYFTSRLLYSMCMR